ncbi:hypothetical protein KPB2_5373 [Klebsiella pneumoniae Kb677]|nr:hypothetical protein KPB2_5373 [Klebsiella pneumoniae Kb677]
MEHPVLAVGPEGRPPTGTRPVPIARHSGAITRGRERQKLGTCGLTEAPLSGDPTRRRTSPWRKRHRAPTARAGQGRSRGMEMEVA